MRCSEVEELKIKYELNELDYFRKKAFERHIKRCSKCKKRYASLLLLGVMLGSSKKIYTPNPISLVLTSPIIKYGLVALVSMAGLFTMETVYNSKGVELRLKDLNSEIVKNEDLGTEKTVERKSSEKELIKRDGIKIIASENDKELELYLDENFNVKKRIEK